MKSQKNQQNKEITQSLNDKKGVVPRGISLLTDKNMLSLLKLPMLDVVYSGLVQKLSLSFREVFGSNLCMIASAPYSLKFEDYMARHSQGATFIVLRAPELSGPCLIAMKNDLVAGFRTMLLGGGSAHGSAASPKSLTGIEMELLLYSVQIIIKSINDAFSHIVPVNFAVARVELESSAARIAKHEDVLSVLRLNVKLNELESCFDLVIPYGSLEQIKKVLSQHSVEGVKTINDPQWVKYLEKEMRGIKVKLELVLDGSVSRVQELLDLKVGHTIVLDKFADEPLEISINGMKVALGKLGQANEKVAVQLVDDINIAKFHDII